MLCSKSASAGVPSNVGGMILAVRGGVLSPALGCFWRAGRAVSPSIVNSGLAPSDGGWSAGMRRSVAEAFRAEPGSARGMGSKLSRSASPAIVSARREVTRTSIESSPTPSSVTREVAVRVAVGTRARTRDAAAEPRFNSGPGIVKTKEQETTYTLSPYPLLRLSGESSASLFLGNSHTLSFVYSLSIQLAAHSQLLLSPRTRLELLLTTLTLSQCVQWLERGYERSQGDHTSWTVT